MSTVIHPPAAESSEAIIHFSKLLEFETDCWDVHQAISNKQIDFVLLDGQGRNKPRRTWTPGKENDWRALGLEGK